MRMLIFGTLAFLGFIGWSVKDDIARNYATPLATADEPSLMVEESSLATFQAPVSEIVPEKLLDGPVVANPVVTNPVITTVEVVAPAPEVAASNPLTDSVLPMELDDIVDLEVLGTRELDAIVEAFDPEQRGAVRAALAEMRALESLE